MNAMTPEEYLLQVKNIDLRIKALEGELHDAEKENDSEYEEKLRSDIKRDLEKYKEIKLRIRNEIQQIEDHKLCTLLTEYYVRGKSWEQVAESINVKSIKNTRENLRAAALKKFAELYPQYFLGYGPLK